MGVGKHATTGFPTDEAKERLMIEAAQKDPARFAELYEDNFERVYAFIVRRVRDRDETEDLTSEVFQRALANLPRFEWRGVPFAVWLFRIAANLIADRSKGGERDVPLEDRVEERVQTDFEELERHARLFRLVASLPPNQCLVINMRFGEEKSIRQIAQQLGRSEGAVKQLQFRALKNLRAMMDESDG